MVHRTCLDCGETWTLEANVTHLHAGRPRGFGVGPRPGQFRLEIALDRIAGFDQEIETIMQLRACPKCGAEHYKDRRA